MKRVFTILVVVSIAATMWAQSPQKMSYQAVIRDASDHLVTTQVGMQISIIQSTVDGTIVYSETQTPTPNINGLVTIEIGGGTVVSGDFETIDWSTGPYFIKTETDPAGGTNYTITGTSQLLSVPYALYSKTADSYNETDPKVGANTTNYLSKWDGTALVKSTIFDNGNIGIGTNSPGEILNIKTTTPDGNIKLEVPDGDGYYIGYNGGGDYMAISVINGGTGYWETLNLKSGNVGIGTTNPSTKLEVNGIITSTGANFTGTTTVSTPVNATDAATKGYVDALKEIIYNELLDAGMNGIVKDIEGNTYKTIKIGNQVWMAENMKTTKYNNGDLIGTTVPSDLDISGETDPKYQWAYAGNEANAAIYGRLYTWYTVTDDRGVCPDGWHVPIHTEWTTLEDYLIANGFNYDGTTTGNKIAKALGSTTLWQSSANAGAIGNTDYPEKRNVTGFTSLPTGYRHPNLSIWYYLGQYGHIWSFDAESEESGWFFSTCYAYNYTLQGGSLKKAGQAVRCLKD